MSSEGPTGVPTMQVTDAEAERRKQVLRQEMKEWLRLKDEDAAELLSSHAMKKLWDGRYVSIDIICTKATRDGLSTAGVPSGLVDAIVAAQAGLIPTPVLPPLLLSPVVLPPQPVLQPPAPMPAATDPVASGSTAGASSEEDVPFSEVETEHWQAIQEKLDLDLKIAEEPDFGAASSGATYESYVWTDRGVKQDGTPVYSEAEESPALMQHVQKELEVKYGVSGFTLYDVHNDKDFLDFTIHNVMLEGQIKSLALHGTAGAVVVPADISRWSAAGAIGLVFDWKSPTAMMQLGSISSLRQIVVELVGALLWSSHPVLVVVTDGVDKMCICEPDDTVIKVLHNCEGLTHNIGPLNLSSIGQGMLYIAKYLLERCSADLTFDVEDAPVGTHPVPASLISASKRIKTALGDGPGPVEEQLQLLDCLPQEERFGAALEIITSWRHRLREA